MAERRRTDGDPGPPPGRPDDRARVGRVAVSLLGWGLVATTILALLALWHLVRRGRILRANLAPPRVVSLPEYRAGPHGGDPID